MLLNANALNIPIAGKTIQTVITSPPYWSLRDYGKQNQLGLETTPEEYVKNMVSAFREVWRVLKDDGTLWINLGDTYSGGGRGCESEKQQSNRGTRDMPRSRPSGLKQKNLVGIPWRVALALQADGWYLRQDIIWAKPNPMPESVTDRCTKSHEYIFLLTKSAHYYYNQDAIRVPYAPASLPRALRGTSENNKWQNGAPGSTAHAISKPRPNVRKEFTAKHGGGGSGLKGHSGYTSADGRLIINPLGRNKFSVWNVSTKPYKGAHFATFPTDLVEPMVLAGSAPGDLVLDPFTGTATVGEVAIKHKRKFVGLELNLAYIQNQAKKRLRQVQVTLF